jgi:hypothetical protein
LRESLERELGFLAIIFPHIGDLGQANKVKRKEGPLEGNIASSPVRQLNALDANGRQWIPWNLRAKGNCSGPADDPGTEAGTGFRLAVYPPDH